MPQSAVMEAVSFDSPASRPTAPPPTDSAMAEGADPTFQSGLSVGMKPATPKAESPEVVVAESAGELVVVEAPVACPVEAEVEPSTSQLSTASQQPVIRKLTFQEPVAPLKSGQSTKISIPQLRKSKSPKPVRAPGPTLEELHKKLKKKSSGGLFRCVQL